MSAILLHHGVNTTTPFADALVQERLVSFSHALTTARLSLSTEAKLWQW